MRTMGRLSLTATLLFEIVLGKREQDSRNEGGSVREGVTQDKQLLLWS